MESKSTILTTEPEQPQHQPVWGFWSTIGLGIAILAVFFVAQLIAAIVVLFARLPPNTSFDVPQQLLEGLMGSIGLAASAGVILSAAVGGALIAVFINAKKGLSIADYLGLKPIKLKTIFIAFGITLAFIAITDSITRLVDRPINPQSMIDMYKTAVVPALLWFAVIIVGPAFEEAFFRGFLFEGFRYSKAGVIGAILITAFVWAIIHVQYEPYEMSVIFVMGIVLGIVRYRTGSLWATFSMHAFMNLIAMVELALSVNSMV